MRIHGIQDNDELSDDTAKVRQAADTRQHKLRTGATSSEPHYWPGQEPQVPPCGMASLGLLHLSLTPWHVHCHSPKWSSHYFPSIECSRVSRQNSPGQKQMFTSSFPHPDTRSTAAAAISWEPCRMFQHCPHLPCEAPRVPSRASPTRPRSPRRFAQPMLRPWWRHRGRISCGITRNNKNPAVGWMPVSYARKNPELNPGSLSSLHHFVTNKQGPDCKYKLPAYLNPSTAR